MAKITTKMYVSGRYIHAMLGLGKLGPSAIVLEWADEVLIGIGSKKLIKYIKGENADN